MVKKVKDIKYMHLKIGNTSKPREEYKWTPIIQINYRIPTHSGACHMYVTVNSEHAPFVESKIAKKRGQTKLWCFVHSGMPRAVKPITRTKTTSESGNARFFKPRSSNKNHVLKKKLRFSNNNGSIFFKRQHDHVRFIRCWTIREETRGKLRRRGTIPCTLRPKSLRFWWRHQHFDVIVTSFWVEYVETLSQQFITWVC